jgi:hypothetical protein
MPPQLPAHQRTIYLDPCNNVATFQLAPGYHRFHAFVAEIGYNSQEELTAPLCWDATLRGQPQILQNAQGFL